VVQRDPSDRERNARDRAQSLIFRVDLGHWQFKAKQANLIALRLCLDRIVSPRRDRPVHFTIPELNSAEDASRAVAAITVAVANGDLTPAEAAELSNVITATSRQDLGRFR
jgi:hypothetical protein